MTADVGVSRPAGAAAVAHAHPRRHQRVHWKSVVSQVLLTVALLFFLAPFAWALLTALKPADEVFSTPPKAIGSEIAWHNFADAWNYLPFGRFMVNGLVVSVLGTLVVIVSSVLAAYAFSDEPPRARHIVLDTIG